MIKSCHVNFQNPIVTNILNEDVNLLLHFYIRNTKKKLIIRRKTGSPELKEYTFFDRYRYHDALQTPDLFIFYCIVHIRNVPINFLVYCNDYIKIRSHYSRLFVTTATVKKLNLLRKAPFPLWEQIWGKNHFYICFKTAIFSWGTIAIAEKLMDSNSNDGKIKKLKQ